MMSNDFLKMIRKSVEKRVSLIPDTPVINLNTLDFCEIFKKSQNPVVISEIKFASPSRGIIYSGKLDHASIASAYLSAGASALSVLTEPEYFKGEIKYISDIRAANPKAPILLKDFILSKKQIEQGLLHGANAILLIVAFLDKQTLKELYDYSIFLGLTPIVEVHNLEELKQILYLKPHIIGINNRNLKSLEINLDTARNLIQHIPDDCYAICESGINTREQINEMQAIGFDGFLIGSSLMQHKNPGIKLHELINDKS